MLSAIARGGRLTSSSPLFPQVAKAPVGARLVHSSSPRAALPPVLFTLAKPLARWVADGFNEVLGLLLPGLWWWWWARGPGGGGPGCRETRNYSSGAHQLVPVSDARHSGKEPGGTKARWRRAVDCWQEVSGRPMRVMCWSVRVTSQDWSSCNPPLSDRQEEICCPDS